jgi:hypothetical protein
VNSVSGQGLPVEVVDGENTVQKSPVGVDRRKKACRLSAVSILRRKISVPKTVANVSRPLTTRLLLAK